MVMLTRVCKIGEKMSQHKKFFQKNSAKKYSLQDVLTMIGDDDSIIEADIFISPPDEDDVLDEIHDQGSFDDLAAWQLLSKAEAKIKQIGGSKKISIKRMGDAFNPIFGGVHETGESFVLYDILEDEIVY
ncbi:hypothetical protein HELRODRAFT_173052 [Helobdella robusta]|uniref:Uncharacterized protein n=1 Tax=Helobdella robusta TaxID=6412 RepID=T1F6A8_HELRO|nr:hypothetical protein HELRODRAFT_173052 [Helobdella robusta]ESO04000.1 hypothetical protein HELRODRAFT_173052 [Helobdella robusta]